MNTTVNTSNCIIKKFKWGEVKIYECELGYVLPLKYVSRYTTISKRSIYNIVSKDKDKFVNCKIKLKIDGSSQTCFTKQGLINTLNKINNGRFPKGKIEKLEDLHALASLLDIDPLKDKNTLNIIQPKQIENNDLKNEPIDIDELFNKMESDLVDTLKRLRSTIKSLKEERDREKQRNNILKDINNKYRIKTLNLQERINHLKYN